MKDEEKGSSIEVEQYKEVKKLFFNNEKALIIQVNED
jgi:hypothetical protein